VSEFLTDPEREQLEREWKGPVYWLRLPGCAVGRDEPLALAVVSDRVKPETVPGGRLADADYVVVKERDARLGGEQVTLDALPGVLRDRRRLPRVGKEALRRAPLKEHYPFDEYVPVDLKEFEGGEGRIEAGQRQEPKETMTEARQFLFDWLTSADAPFCALLGDYGMGKTFLCRVFTADVLERREDDHNLPVPLYLDMRSLPPWTGGPMPGLEHMVDVLCEKADFADVSASAVLAAVHLGHVALIFDGFDEKAAHMTEGEATALMNEIRRAAPAGSKGKVLVACRTHYFESRPHEREKVGGGDSTRTREGLRAADFRIVYLQPFDEDRIRAYLKKLFAGEAERIYGFLTSVHDLMDLAHRPYLLFLITQHLAELEALAADGRRVGAADVYETVVEEWMKRDTGKHTIKTHVKVALMEELARRLWEEGRKQIHFRELHDWLQKQTVEKLQAVSLGELDRIDADLRTATFLARDGEGNYRFAHTSFQEFFLARHVAAGLPDERVGVLDLPRLRKEVIEFTIDLLHRSDTESAAFALQSVLEEEAKRIEKDAAGQAALSGAYQSSPLVTSDLSSALAEEAERLGQGDEQSGEPPAPSVREQPLAVVCIAGSLTGQRWPIGAEKILVGRESGVTITIPVPHGSRRHAEISADGSKVVLKDLGSRSGTLVDGAKIKTRELAPGDVFEIGGARFRVQFHED